MSEADWCRSISPSAYIVFPTLSAANGCGLLGQVHTSVTYPVAPGDLSTMVGYSSYSFDFADALCPPTLIFDVDYISMVGQGYKPVIAAISALTSLDREWGYSCAVAPFQGNDPPIALMPTTNLILLTTDPVDQPEKTPASPSSTTQPIPVQTAPPAPPAPSSEHPSSIAVGKG